MKKLSVLLLALTMCFFCVGLTACSSKKSAPERDVILGLLDDKPSPVYYHDNCTGVSLKQRIFSKESPNLCLVEYSVQWENEETECYYAILKRENVDSKWEIESHVPVVISETADPENQVSREASIEGVKQAVKDYYNSKPFKNMWYYGPETVTVENDDWMFNEIKETEKNKFRVSGTYNEYECDTYGYRASYPDNKTFDHYVTYYPDSGNYDVTYVFG